MRDQNKYRLNFDIIKFFFNIPGIVVKYHGFRDFFITKDKKLFVNKSKREGFVMKKTIAILGGMILICAGMVFYGCTKKNEISIIGEWEAIEMEGRPVDTSEYKFVMILNEDNSFTGYRLKRGRKNEWPEGSWQLLEDKKELWISAGGERILYSVERKEENLIMTNTKKKSVWKKVK